MCMEIESGWNCAPPPPTYCCFLCWELACFAKWLTAQPRNKHKYLTQLKSVHSVLSFLLCQLVWSVRLGFRCIKTKIWIKCPFQYCNLVWLSLRGLYSFVLRFWVWVNLPTGSEQHPGFSQSFMAPLCFQARWKIEWLHCVLILLYVFPNTQANLPLANGSVNHSEVVHF